MQRSRWQIRRLIAAAALLLAPSVVGAAPGPERSLTLLNQSRQAIQELYVSSAREEDWGDDQLGDTEIAPARNFFLRLGRVRDCVFDVRVVYADGSVEERHGFDLCRSRALAFDGSTAERIGDHEVTIANAAARPLREIYISSEQTSGWGNDLLGDTPLAPAGRTQVRYRGGCHGDVRVVFDNDGAEERYGLDLCARAAVTIAPGWATAD